MPGCHQPMLANFKPRLEVQLKVCNLQTCLDLLCIWLAIYWNIFKLGIHVKDAVLYQMFETWVTAFLHSLFHCF